MHLIGPFQIDQFYGNQFFRLLTLTLVDGAKGARAYHLAYSVIFDRIERRSFF